MENKNVVFLNHPLIQHKISMLRDEKTGTNEFRKLVSLSGEPFNMKVFADDMVII